MNVLMLSSSKYAQHDYLAYAYEWINEHLNTCDEVLFIPYAAVSFSWDVYVQNVQDALPKVKINGIHQYDDPQQAVKQAQAIMVGGGNTFKLLHDLYQYDLLKIIIEKVKQNTPYIGWSAGSNICGESICTTNDMPIIEPPSLKAMSLLPIQINPHYTDYVSPDHHGETRDQRLGEFCILNPTKSVLAIKEGSALLLKDYKLSLLGDLNGFVFHGEHKLEVKPQQDLSEYL